MKNSWAAMQIEMLVYALINSATRSKFNHHKEFYIIRIE